MSLKFKEYVDNLVELLNDNPEYAELDVVYSRDDEGNGFQKVYYTPTVGHHDGEYHGEFKAYNTKPDIDPEDTCTEEEINSVCIN